ncbi:metal ABC transporter ATP-binding protein [Atopobium deltae]|uniref:ABC transporter, ATP-binding protein n=1 Tax=Atopobium deltae TaxID=1393034 RepID=A0A133XW53_9ACTN|nr:ATP-binding cassette domain-containing protein [Atopobium deltae]KXB35165.1 ABC transporter, ATP-binding protein [Atopobium deltae]
MHIIDVSELTFGYTADPVLRGIDFCVEKGEACCITGENGSGKSTLLKVLLGELKGFKGKVELFGTPIDKLTDLTRIGYVPQASVMDKVAFPTTCCEMVCLGLYNDFGFIKVPRKKHIQKASTALKQMGLSTYINVPFNELSGGLQQRVMITRALINNPQLLILDEPTAGVDNDSKISFLDTLERIRKERDITTLLVSHELELVCRHVSFDATYKIDAGRMNRA